jgi:hypothetical protein
MKSRLERLDTSLSQVVAVLLKWRVFVVTPGGRLLEGVIQDERVALLWVRPDAKPASCLLMFS